MMSLGSIRSHQTLLAQVPVPKYLFLLSLHLNTRFFLLSWCLALLYQVHVMSVSSEYSLVMHDVESALVISIYFLCYWLYLINFIVLLFIVFCFVFYYFRLCTLKYIRHFLEI